MSNGNQKRTRQERVAAVELPPGAVGRTLGYLQQGRVLLRIGLCALTAIMLWAITGGWKPPFTYSEGYLPSRDIVASIDFEQADPEATEEARIQARALTLGIFEQDAEPLKQLRAKLLIKVVQIAAAETLADLGAEIWQEFEPPLDEGATPPTDEERQTSFEQFKKVLTGEGAIDAFSSGVQKALAPFEQQGLLKEMPTDNEGQAIDINQERILMRPKGSQKKAEEVPVPEVLSGSAAAAMQKELEKELPSNEVAQRAFTWLKPQLPESTLVFQADETSVAQKEAAEQVEELTKRHARGEVLAKAVTESGDAQPLSEESLELLRLEYYQALAQQTVPSVVNRSLATFGMYLALYVLCGFYIYHRQPALLANLGPFCTLLAMVVLTVAACNITHSFQWDAELVPLLLFAMAIAIAYRQELALLLSAAVILIVTMSVGGGLQSAVISMSAMAGAILQLRNVRSRSKLLIVGAGSGAIVMMTTLGVGTLSGQPLSALISVAMWYALLAVLAGALMTCVLPLIERLFNVQTDLSLIELGDPAKPLLQELIRRAPGTYNHSITVASLAEAAAEAIGARGLLVRVGAYFHDIGKMLKPGYFVENQGQGDNRHESLMPAMSTLVIIAHVKDGADLARQNRLPEVIVDFIQQHHGTTLVEYFYRRANEQKQADPEGGEVDESSFRYPGPKPQTKEAGVLMLADAVESASRVLVEPTPARIENLVEDITMKRLLDGQFDECGLTLQEVHTIGESLVKSLTAVYHGRVKYPGQQTA